MLQLRDKYGYAINPKNVCLVEAGNPRTPWSTGILVWGKDSRMTYEYENPSDMQADLNTLMRLFGDRGLKAEGAEDFGSYYINMDNIFSVGQPDGHRLEVHFSGGFRNIIMLKDAAHVRKIIMERA